MASGSTPQDPSHQAGQAAKEEDSVARDAELARRMAELSQRLSRGSAKADATKGKSVGDGAGMGQGFRAAADLSGGVIVGVILGLGLDRIVGSSPWGLIVFVLLGFAAGVLNMLRGVGLAPKPGSDKK